MSWSDKHYAVEVALDEGGAGALHGAVGAGPHGDADLRLRERGLAGDDEVLLTIDEAEAGELLDAGAVEAGLLAGLARLGSTKLEASE